MSALNKITRNNQRNSPLLRLPAELRHAIYSIISADTYISVKSLSRHTWKISDTTPLRLTCHQINQEVRTFAHCATLKLWRPLKDSDLTSLFTWPGRHSIVTIELTYCMNVLDYTIGGDTFMQEFHSAFVGLRRVVVWPVNDFDELKTWLPDHLR
ncbi:hypothetical protein N0V95_005453 [Ascochyta clinopodiicola]|nr:hypothetical protein N0V95_005453 [Ascochyta clinopodiicola]